LRHAALVASLLLAACESHQAAAPATPAAPALRTAAVEVRDVELTFSTEALVEAVRQSTVSAQVAGRIVDIRFDVGDRVAKGEVIVRIDERAAPTRVLAEAECRREQVVSARQTAEQLERLALVRRYALVRFAGCWFAHAIADLTG